MGLFIAFEGLDGSGLSTQAAKLSEWFTANKYSCVLTKEPTVSLIGGFIKSILRKEWKTDSMTLQLLFCADRSHHLNTEILPALKSGKVVITDRYLFSTLAFGSADPLIDVSVLEKINSQFLQPDITFFIDVPAKVSLERIKTSRFDTELFEREEKLEKTRQAFLELTNKSKNFYRVDGTQSIEDVHEVVKEIVKRAISKRNFGVQRSL